MNRRAARARGRARHPGPVTFTPPATRASPAPAVTPARRSLTPAAPPVPPVSRCPTEEELASLPFRNAANIAAYRAAYGVDSHEDLQHVVTIRHRLIDAYNALMETEDDPAWPRSLDGCQEAMEGLAAAIGTLDAVLDPSEEALRDFFVEVWSFVVVGGELRAYWDQELADVQADVYGEVMERDRLELEADDAWVQHRYG